MAVTVRTIISLGERLLGITNGIGKPNTRYKSTGLTCEANDAEEQAMYRLSVFHS